MTGNSQYLVLGPQTDSPQNRVIPTFSYVLNSSSMLAWAVLVAVTIAQHPVIVTFSAYHDAHDQYRAINHLPSLREWAHLRRHNFGE